MMVAIGVNLSSGTRFFVPAGVYYQQSVCFPRQAEPFCWRCCFGYLPMFVQAIKSVACQWPNC
jgi:hypothetical protein